VFHRFPRRFFATLGALTSLGAGGILVASAAASEWPGWRGANRDGYTQESLPLKLASPPPVRWRKSVGHGYAGPVIGGNFLVLAEESGGKETVKALKLATGDEVWSTPVAPVWNDEFEHGPRCTPLVGRDRVFFQSNQGEFVCLDLATGRRKWGFHFSDYGAFWVPSVNSPIGAANRRGNSASALLDGDRVVVSVGSTNGAALCAFSIADGTLVWKTLNDLTTYVSPVIGTLAGERQVVTATCEGLVGVAAADGTLRWRVPFKTQANRNVLTPILEGNTVSFGSFTTGFRRVEISRDGAAFVVGERWLNSRLKINLSTPVLAGGAYYGLGPAKNFVCFDARDGAVRWDEKDFGDVASVVTDGSRLLVLLDSGEVRLLNRNPERYEELGRFQACGKSFSYPAWSEGILYVRDGREVVAYEFSGAK
jgi:outer membrane protein assembly factor BamB